MAPFKGEREKEKALLLSLCPLPTHLSVVSQDFIYSSSGPVIQHLTKVKFSANLNIQNEVFLI